MKYDSNLRIVCRTVGGFLHFIDEIYPTLLPKRQTDELLKHTASDRTTLKIQLCHLKNGSESNIAAPNANDYRINESCSKDVA